jgi:hypothetical protein
MINQTDLGKLYCRAYYHLKEETLYVESKIFIFKSNIINIYLVISCKNLKPCDSNGLRYKQNLKKQKKRSILFIF